MSWYIEFLNDHGDWESNWGPYEDEATARDFLRQMEKSPDISYRVRCR